jgi:hypothetical protein
LQHPPEHLCLDFGRQISALAHVDAGETDEKLENSFVTSPLLQKGHSVLSSPLKTSVSNSLPHLPHINSNNGIFSS